VKEKVLQVLSKTCGEWVVPLARSSELRSQNADVRRAKLVAQQVPARFHTITNKGRMDDVLRRLRSADQAEHARFSLQAAFVPALLEVRCSASEVRRGRNRDCGVRLRVLPERYVALHLSRKLQLLPEMFSALPLRLAAAI